MLTTQHLDEADQLADRVAVIDRGRHRHQEHERGPADKSRRRPAGRAWAHTQ
jgi:ABC-type multidrug transport system ATPase subunit